MSRLTSGRHELLSRLTDVGRGRRSTIARRSEFLGPHPGWMIAGVAAVGLGMLAVYYVGPDVKRYFKLKNM